jgi:hypothetical protein
MTEILPPGEARLQAKAAPEGEIAAATRTQMTGTGRFACSGFFRRRFVGLEQLHRMTRHDRRAEHAKRPVPVICGSQRM